MSVENFISNVAAGKSAEAADQLVDLLSAKAFQALETRKEELAKSIFTQEPQTEVEVESETEEETEE